MSWYMFLILVSTLLKQSVALKAHFYKLEENEGVSDLSTLKKLTVTSEVDCVSRCELDNKCFLATYRKSTKDCYIQTNGCAVQETIGAVGWIVFHKTDPCFNNCIQESSIFKMDRVVVCRFYFDLGFKYSDIIEFLAKKHNIIISMTTLKRLFKKEGLFRRKFRSDILEVAKFIQEQLDNGSQLGYRSMHLRCIQNLLCVSRDTVSILMQILDKKGIEFRLKRRLRRRKYYASGPNFLWHVDSYDKLKKFGICINGCIDGFSRNIIWLCANQTSSDPKVIGGYFIEAVSKRGGCPSIVRGDMGTENGYIAQMQEFLTTRANSFIYGKSTGNQRIEMLWSFFRRQCSQVWIDILSDLRDNGQFNGEIADKNLVQFCFHRLIQNDIDRMVMEWNSHNIRPTKNQNCPSGRPSVMYELPHLYSTRNFLNYVQPVQIEACREECTFRGRLPCDSDFHELFMIYMKELNKELPKTPNEAIELYIALRTQLYIDL